MKRKITTLCLLRNGNKILLSRKKQGFGAGRINGYGGKVRPGETVEAAARREVREESGLVVEKLDPVAEISFLFPHDELEMIVHIFSATEWSGEPQENDEMALPEWYDVDSLPYEQMWADDLYWYPLYLAGKRFRGTFVFDPDHRVVEHQLNEIKPDAGN